MRRSWLRIVVPALVLLLFAVVSAAVWALTTFPSYTADALTRALGQKVEVAAIDVQVGLRLEVEVRGLRVHSTLETSELPVLEAPLARGRQSWPRVLVGQLVPLDWELEDPIARVVLPSEGGGELPRLPLRSIKALRARLEVDAGPRGRFTIDQLTLEVEQRALLGGLTGTAAGRVAGSRGVIGRGDVSFALTDEHTEISGRVANLTLSRVLPLTPAVERLRWMRGRADGRFAVAWGAGDFSASGDIALRKLSVKVDGFDQPFETESARLAGDLMHRSGVWTVRPDSFGIGDFSFAGTIGIDARPNGRVTAKLDVADFSIAPRSEGAATPERVTLISLLGAYVEALRPLEQRIAAGTFELLDLTLDLPVAQIGSLLAFERPLAPEELSVGISMRDATLLSPSGAAPLEDVSGRFELMGDRFLMHALSISRQGKRYPTVNLELDGFSRYVHLSGDERRIPRGPGVPIPGLGPAFRALRRDDDAKEKPETKAEPHGELSIEFRNLWVGFPAFFFQIRNASGRIRFPEGALVVERARAIVSGAPADLSVKWEYEPDVIDVKLTYVAGEAPAPQAQEGRWLAGSFAIGELPVGAWLLRELTGHIQGKEGEIRFDRLLAELGGGRLQGNGTVDLTQNGVAPIRFDLDLSAADASAATAFMNLGDASVTGTASAKLALQGTLDPERRFMQTSDLQVGLDFRDGTLKNMPIAMQIARLPSLEGIRALFGQALPYDTLSGQVSLRKGVLELEEFSVLGPQLRTLAAGEIDLNTEERESDLVVAFLFLQTLDRVIGKVPLVGDMLLGDDGSLVTLTFRVRGPVANPSVAPATPATLQNAADWTGGWLRRMREMIPGLRGEGGAEETPAPPDSSPQPSDLHLVEPPAEEPHEGPR